MGPGVVRIGVGSRVSRSDGRVGTVIISARDGGLFRVWWDRRGSSKPFSSVFSRDVLTPVLPQTGADRLAAYAAARAAFEEELL